MTKPELLEMAEEGYWIHIQWVADIIWRQENNRKQRANHGGIEHHRRWILFYEDIMTVIKGE